MDPLKVLSRGRTGSYLHFIKATKLGRQYGTVVMDVCSGVKLSRFGSMLCHLTNWDIGEITKPLHASASLSVKWR